MADTGPAAAGWRLSDDKTNRLLDTISVESGREPRIGEVLQIKEHPRWLVTRVELPTPVDWSKSPPVMYWSVCGHKI
jgi:hypothetical protein